MPEDSPTPVMSAPVRKVLYGVFGWVSLAEVCAAVGFAAGGTGLPTWLVVTQSVTAAAGAGLGFMARANTDQS